MSVIIKHADGEEYIIAITTDLLSGLNEYLTQFYPESSRVYVNEVPISCKQWAGEPTLLICESTASSYGNASGGSNNAVTGGISVYKVVLKPVPGWVTTSEKYRAEYLFTVRSVKIGRDVLSKFLLSPVGTKIARDSLESKNDSKSRELTELSELRERDRILSERLDILVSLTPKEVLSEYISICRTLKTNEYSL